MNINERYNSTNFKSIKLNKQETLKAKDILSKYSYSDNRAREHLTADLLDIFNNKIEKEGKLIAKSTHSADDCIQDLFLNFFEGIRESIKEKDPLKFILNKLNSFKKGKDSLKTEFGRASIDRTISTKKNTRFSDVITEDISSKIDTESKEKAKTIIDSTTDNGSLTEQEKLVLEKLREVEKQ